MSKNKLASCPIRPLADRIVVLPDEPAKQSKGGILLPDVAKQQSQQGRVLVIGPGKRIEGIGNEYSSEANDREPMDVEEGDTVLFGYYSGSDVEIDGVKYKMLREDDILGIVEEPDAFAPND